MTTRSGLLGQSRAWSELTIQVPIDLPPRDRAEGIEPVASDHVFGPSTTCSPFSPLTTTLPAPSEPSSTPDHLDLALLEQPGEPSDQSVDDGVLAFEPPASQSKPASPGSVTPNWAALLQTVVMTSAA